MNEENDKIKGLYVFIVDHINESKEFIKNTLNINENNVLINLKTNDLSVQIRINSEKNKKIMILNVNRLDEYIINDNYLSFIDDINHYLKVRERRKKILYLKNRIQIIST
jgi:hypothetical protein